ncbi:leucine--tRNA ligase [Candidatus Kuenenbacteria bacterium CG11_big_fil_rev_8_21_14_0_20_37_9]|uniref:Leucine--tRNA ligase n=2 Tax=Candidatus Kueneniibacteriota TaxID=1752740 RepID=A0A2M6XRU3_9BACT|nr:MAG: leucine--tRNA ligase [Candidatus Kuenenbacteria bacterium CG1_02_38_13]PIR05381.1 MAG: leucine--tRNA ligase [Candidatus Kuenenbacteria bacterium CG11_big_fil_rev_8_21_14_0_20_37_9]PIU10362.1 MAG: leucine--tRNA ligase [Candidatus Kuenenbacteria bacterium CG08_land_8_20_14_0_20_37_23]
MGRYDFEKIEKKWQKYWADHNTFDVHENQSKNKYYCLDMFPYPSSAGLHVGHPEGYTATDIVARYRRMRYNENVLHPIGFDAFGLPAENYAIKINRNPKEITQENIDNFTKQLKSLGFSYDWSRIVNTSDPSYYKWTQWMFRELYQKGLAYKKKAPVNWCESCKTVLAREQVVDGKCERCKNEVIQKELSQWFFKITDYADELLANLDKLDWPEPIKEIQRNWIGRSEGVLIKFKISPSATSLASGKLLADNSKLPNESQFLNSNDQVYLEIFTTRPDTLFGATFMVIAPEHKLINKMGEAINNKQEIDEYIREASKKNELERTDLNKEKTGVELNGLEAINPVNNKKIPIFIADYVMMNYGTGAIMAVPAHDKRDFEFAKKYKLPIIEVVRQITEQTNNNQNIIPKQIPNYEFQIPSSTYSCFSDEGISINSGEFNGLITQEFKEKIIRWLEGEKIGQKAVNYKLRDWLVSRQRYWGAPIPIIYCEKCGEILVPEKDLPIKLPNDVDFRPTGESPLTRSKKFHAVKCPRCGATHGVRREPDTMDTFVCSSWYFLRYVDPHNYKKPFSRKKVKYWLPVDLYVGGAEHAVLHLMYARFFIKVLRDAGYLDFDEPFAKLRNQGMILAEDGRKMSKSLGNVINPDDIIALYGADTFRLYEMFMGPLEDAKPWSTKSIIGIRRFLEKIWKLQTKCNKQLTKNKDSSLERLLHKTIKKITEDIEAMKFNTAISQMMILANKMEKQERVSIIDYQLLITILSPFAPHIAEEIWSKLGNKNSIAQENWPVYNQNLIEEREIELAIQINGKVRDKITVQTDIAEDGAIQKALESVKIKNWLTGKDPKKVIYIKGKLISFVV